MADERSVSERFFEEVDKPYEPDEQQAVLPAEVRETLLATEELSRDFDLNMGPTALRQHFRSAITPEKWQEVPGQGAFATLLLGTTKPRNNVTVAYIGENDTPPIHVHLGDPSRMAKPAEVTGTYLGSLIKLSTKELRVIAPGNTPTDRVNSIDIYTPQRFIAAFAERNPGLLEKLGVRPEHIGKGWLGVYQQIGNSSSRLQLDQLNRAVAILVAIELELRRYGEEGANIYRDNRFALDNLLRASVRTS